MITWVQRKLGGLAEFSKGNGYSKSDLTPTGTPIILYGRLYTKYETVIDDFDTFAEMKDKSVISSGGEVIVPSSGETAEDISRASVVGKAGIILGGDLNIVKPRPEIHPAFLAITISNGNQQKELSKRAQGKSVVHINNSDLKDVTLQLPTLLEQAAIGNFFNILDTTITRHKRKLELLKGLKKAYLQQMFPQGDKLVPNIRFGGFVDVWNEKQLKYIFIKGGSGGTPTSTNKDFYDGNIPFLSISDITNSNGIVTKTEKSITELGLSNSSAWIVPKGAICLAMYASIGKFAILNIDVATSQAFYNMVFENEIIRDFMFHTFSLYQETNLYTTLISTGTQANLNADKIRNIMVLLPNDEEQKLICAFFNSLNSKIRYQQTQLGKLKQLKQAYLQKMFV